MEVNGKALSYGILSGLGILLFFILILTIFQSYGFAVSEFKRLWYWLVPLVSAGVKTSGTVSGGSMVACCSHYLLNLLPIIGITGLTSFLMIYQKAFFSIGILSSIFGIGLMLNHRNKMKGVNVVNGN